MKSSGSFKKGKGPNRGLFGEKHPKWKGGIGYRRELQKEYLRNLRKSTLESLGGKCINCAFADFRALQIDHINGGGSRERKTKSFGGNFHMHVLRSFMAKENKYQLLCANCNWIKRFENNERNS